MASEPHGSPAAPERSVRAGRVISRAAGALLAVVIVSLLAVNAGAPGAAVESFLLVSVVTAAAFIQAQRLRQLRLQAAKRALAASELAYRGIYERLAIGILTIGPEGRARAANPALLSLLGFASERELAVVDFGEQVYSAPGTFELLLRRVRVDGEIPAVDLQLRRRDGLPLTVAATIRAHWDAAGEVDRYEAALLDIGDLKFAERQRRALERRFRKLFESGAVGILFGNLRRGSLDEANAKLREMVGLRGIELPVLLDGLTADGERPLGESIRAALESDGHTPPLETVYERGDGTRVAALVCASVLDPLQGDFVAVVVEHPAAADAQVRVASSDALFSSVLDALPVPVARFNRSAQLTYCNGACREWLGFPAVPMGLSLDDVLGVDGPASMRGAVARVLEGATQQSTTELFVAGASLSEVEVILTPHRRDDGTVGGFLLTMRMRGDTSMRDTSASIPAAADGTYNTSVR